MKKFCFIVVLMVQFGVYAQFFPVLEFNQIDKHAQIQRLGIEVDIVGNVAETSVDITFFNPNDRIMEGTLKFPLTPSQEIVEFHLDVNGKLRKASVVEKQKGRVAYEATIRQNIDPGLVEKTKDNSFKARVFPIPAKGYKRARFKVQEELKKANGKYNYTLPLKSDYVIPEFSLKVTNYGDNKPTSEGNLDFSRWQNTYTMEFNKKDYKLDKSLDFDIPQTNKKTWVQDSYFYSIVDVKDLFNAKESNKPSKPHDITVLWDISGSSNKRNKELEFEYLREFVKSLNAKSKIRVIPFNINTYKEKTFSAKDIEKILEYLESFRFDGGTSLKSLNFKSTKSDKIMMFTDGVSTMDYNFVPKIPNTPIDTISSSFNSNTSLLRYYSLKTGGSYINLLSGQEVYQRPKLIGIKTSGVDEVYTDLEVDSNSFALSGILTGDSGKVELNFLKADGSNIKKTVSIKNSEDDVNINLKRLWALKKVESLDLIYDVNKDEITKLGKEFGIVTRNTSLIVLDRVEDYVEYDISPPDELKNEWDKLMSKKKKEQRKSDDDNLSEALNEMLALQSWWKRDFPKDRPRPIIKEEVDGANESYSIAESSEPLRSRESIAPIAESEEEMSMDMEMKKSKADDIGDRDSITVEGWTPKASYFKDLSKLKGKKLLEKYYDLREEYKNRPSFFVDVATLFYESGDKGNSLLVISNVVEMGLEEPELLRITMFLLEKFGFTEEALEVSLMLLDIRPEEPQTYRDIANLSLLNNEFQQALEYYYKVLTGSWDPRFIGIKSVVLNEMNYLVNQHNKELNLESIDDRLIFNMPLDVRAVISWSSDNNDIDLWVKDPYEEDCGYSNSLTHTGGKLSNDFTGGYGPEEFSIKEALYGTYNVDINFYSDNRMSVSGPVTIKVDLYKNYGEDAEKVTIIRRLSDVKERITIGNIKF